MEIDLVYTDADNKFQRIYDYLAYKPLCNSVYAPALRFINRFRYTYDAQGFKQWREEWAIVVKESVLITQEWSASVQISVMEDLEFVGGCMFGKATRNNYSVLHGKSIRQYLISHKIWSNK